MRGKSRSEHDDVVRALIRATSAFNQIIKQRIKEEFNITSVQTQILMLMAAEPSMLGNDVAAAMGVYPSTVSNALDGLEKCGMITRRRSTEDRRIVRITLTRLAKRIARRAIEISEGATKTLTEGISKSELQAMQQGLKKMADNSQSYTHSLIRRDAVHLSRKS